MGDTHDAIAQVAPGPVRIGDATAALPLYDISQTRLAEATALAALPPHTLMARAGLAVARLAVALAPHARRCTVLVGPGNNGGDGLIAAGHLQQLGREVQIWHMAGSPVPTWPADAADAWRQARARPLEWTTDPAHVAASDLVIDALLGIGATRPPGGAMAEVLRATAAGPAPTLAVDVPSGLDADTGSRLGDEAARARWTLSLLTLKPGLFTADGRDHAGDVWFDTLQVPVLAPPRAWLGTGRTSPRGQPTVRRHSQHKGSFGDVVVIGGAAGMPGAAVLAARAALGAGAGRVFLASLDPMHPGLLPPEIMTRSLERACAPETLGTATVVCGCGGGPAIADVLPPLVQHAARLVLDADALNAVAARSDLADALRGRASRGLPTVLTPHPLEAARLLGTTAGVVQANRLHAAHELARRVQSVVVLKGSGTVVAGPQDQPWINGSGNARLAAPGSGDVLAGWLAGEWSSGPPANGVATACRSVWRHGRAADIAPGPAHLPLRAGDLIDWMASVPVA